MTTNAERIQKWRDANPEKRLTMRVIENLLGVDVFCGDDLRGANLRGADLRWADLRWADMRGADLRRADLRDANLREANLQEADLLGADLCRTALDGFVLQGLPPGSVHFIATPKGWRITIGHWKHKTLDDLRALLAGEDNWLVAKGEERGVRYPIFAGLLAMCEAYVAKNPSFVRELAAIHKG